MCRGRSPRDFLEEVKTDQAGELCAPQVSHPRSPGWGGERACPLSPASLLGGHADPGRTSDELLLAGFSLRYCCPPST